MIAAVGHDQVATGRFRNLKRPVKLARSCSDHRQSRLPRADLELRERLCADPRSESRLPPVSLTATSPCPGAPLRPAFEAGNQWGGDRAVGNVDLDEVPLSCVTKVNRLPLKAMAVGVDNPAATTLAIPRSSFWICRRPGSARKQHRRNQPRPPPAVEDRCSRVRHRLAASSSRRKAPLFRSAT